ncbi:hypothetical protein NEOLEDRAFT_1034269, partial [Neolentinus lepideus HHB14362 ss-1]
RLTEAQQEQYKKEGHCFICGSKEHLAIVHKTKGNTKKPFTKVHKAKDDEDLKSKEEESDKDKEEEMFKQLTLNERVEIFGELEGDLVNEQSLFIPVIIGWQDIETKALIDSGCMGKIMSNKFAREHKFPTHRLPKSIIARMADGTIMKGGLITHCVYAKMKIKGKAKLHRFVLANVEDDVILGYDWL